MSSVFQEVSVTPRMRVKAKIWRLFYRIAAKVRRPHKVLSYRLAKEMNKPRIYRVEIH